MKLEEMVNEFPQDFLSEEEIENLKREKGPLEREFELAMEEMKDLIKNEVKESTNYCCSPWCDYFTENGDCLLGWSCGDCGEEYGDDDE